MSDVITTIQTYINEIRQLPLTIKTGKQDYNIDTIRGATYHHEEQLKNCIETLFLACNDEIINRVTNTIIEAKEALNSVNYGFMVKVPTKRYPVEVSPDYVRSVIDVKINSINSVLTFIAELSNKKDAAILPPQEISPIPSFNERPLNIHEAAEYLSLSVNTIYQKVKRREIPCSKRNGRLYFDKQKLRDYVEQGQISSIDEIRKEADKYVRKRR